MPSELSIGVGPRNHVLDGVQDPSVQEQFWGGKGAARCKVYGPSAVSCTKTAEPIDMPFGVWTRLAQGSMCYIEVHIGAIWRIRLNRPCAAAMRPYVKLLWSVVVEVWAVAEEPRDARRHVGRAVNKGGRSVWWTWDSRTKLTPLATIGVTWRVKTNLNYLLKDIWRSHAVRYFVNVVISRCEVQTLLLQTTNRKSYMAWRIVAMPTILILMENYGCGSYTISY